MASLQSIIESQLSYYKERATEYDQWWDRVGRYAEGEEKDKKWNDDIKSAQGSIGSFISKEDKVLELASGTGIWTKFLAESVDVAKIKCVDGTKETLEVLKDKFIKSGLEKKLNHIEFEVADLLGEWTPTGEPTVIFMGFFFSHVPPSKIGQFLSKLKLAAAKNSVRIVLIDSYYEDSNLHVAAKDYSLREGIKAIDYDANEPDDKFLIYRKLNSGETHSIVKVYYEPHVMQEVFAKHGISGEAKLTPNKHFILGNFVINP